MAHRFTTSYIQGSLAIFRQCKSLAERAMAQVTDEQLTRALDAESNSIAVIVATLLALLRPPIIRPLLNGATISL